MNVIVAEYVFNYTEIEYNAIKGHPVWYPWVENDLINASRVQQSLVLPA